MHLFRSFSSFFLSHLNICLVYMIEHIVLSGGGQIIFNYLGIFQYLFESKYIHIDEIKSIYGTSSGSLLGAILCLKYDWVDIVEYILKCPWETRLKVSLDKAIRVFENNGIFDRELFIQIYKPLLSGKNMSIDVTLKEFYDYSKIDFHIYAFEMNEFEEIDISHRTHPDLKLLDAIQMSCSIPLLIKPIAMDGKYYIDGGIVANYPLHECLESEKCDETSVFGIRVFSTREISSLDQSSSISDLMMVTMKRMLQLIRKDRVYPTISNEMQMYSVGISAQHLIDALFEKDIRETYVNEGIRTAKEYLEYRKFDSKGKLETFI